jgi:hypothetical protein
VGKKGSPRLGGEEDDRGGIWLEGTVAADEVEEVMEEVVHQTIQPHKIITLTTDKINETPPSSPDTPPVPIPLVLDTTIQVTTAVNLPTCSKRRR